MTTDVTTTNLQINVLGKTEYANIQNKSNYELYVVKENNADTDNGISSKTYADVGREAVYYGPTAPASQWAKIWIDTSDDPVLVSPASINMDNLTATGIKNLQTFITPNLSEGTVLSLSAAGVYTLPSAGWIYTISNTNSELKLLNKDNLGNTILHIKTDTNIASDRLFLNKGDKIYVDIISGSNTITFYPCRSSV